MNNVQQEFEETLKRIQSQNGVVGVIVVNNNGVYSNSVLLVIMVLIGS